MKKIFIGLLLAAAGAGVYFFILKKKKEQPLTGNINREWIAGKWKVDSLSNPDTSGMNIFAYLLYMSDSNARQDIYNFQDNGQLITSHPSDSFSRNDTARFKWANENTLVVFEKSNDPAGDSLTIEKLDKKNMLMRHKDSTRIVFSKAD